MQFLTCSIIFLLNVAQLVCRDQFTFMNRTIMKYYLIDCTVTLLKCRKKIMFRIDIRVAQMFLSAVCFDPLRNMR